MCGSMDRSETEVAMMLGTDKRMLRRARLSGAVNPRREGRAFRYSDADIAEYLASRPTGLNAKQAAAALGVSRAQLARYRKSGRLEATPAAGVARLRYVYDPADLEPFRG